MASLDIVPGKLVVMNWAESNLCPLSYLLTALKMSPSLQRAQNGANAEHSLPQGAEKGPL